MNVNDLARRVGIAPHVVRYYSQRGLLSPARNARNAYREYGDADLRRLRFICRAKALGFTLDDISLILKAADGGATVGRQITQLVQERSQENEKRLADAQQLHRRICDAVTRWSASPEGSPSAMELRELIDGLAREG